jgi:hypothetical protein
MYETLVGPGRSVAAAEHSRPLLGEPQREMLLFACACSTPPPTTPQRFIFDGKREKTRANKTKDATDLQTLMRRLAGAGNSQLVSQVSTH